MTKLPGTEPGFFTTKGLLDSLRATYDKHYFGLDHLTDEEFEAWLLRQPAAEDEQ